ncbi:hypothetical protein FAI40_01610 [Acetobacteraceae bacterium]|nr:hypothetical protein FAI40_01610 [Acetobacteraceae bacterium]
MSFPVSLVDGLPGQFLECSFRGIPFAVTKGSGTNGRKTAVHEYPMKDGVWVEDLGRKGRQFRISGFMVGALGYSQRDLLSRACEIPGPGLLVHPSLGAIQAVCVNGLQWSEREGVFNVIDLEMEFVEQSNLFNVIQTTAAHATIGTLSASTSLISSNGFIASANPLAGGSDAVISAATATGTAWAAPLVNFSKSPTFVSKAQSSQSISDFRVSLNDILSEMGSALNVEEIASAMSSLPSVITGSDFSVSDKMQMLFPLFNILDAADETMSDNLPVTISGKKRMLSSMASYLGGFLSIGPLCEVISQYKPDNSLDALGLLQKLKVIFETLVILAPDSWEGLSENLFNLRAQTVNYLLNQATSLSDMIEVDAPSSLPSLALAQILYGDGSRSSEIEAENQTVHPAFMPSNLTVKAQ